MKMNRREFLAASLVGAGTVILGGAPINAGPSVDPYQMVELGKTGIKVSLIGMGTGMRGGGNSSSLTRMDKAKAAKLIRHAYDCGVRYFDCADLYGSHQVVGETLKDVSDKVVIASKIWVRGGNGTRYKDTQDAVATLDRFRKELGRDMVDFVQLHCMTDDTWHETYKAQTEGLSKLKEKGIVRAHGITIHKIDAMKSAVGDPWVETIHVRVNATGDYMDLDKKANVVADDIYPVIQKLHDGGKGVIGLKLIGQGTYRDKNTPELIDASIAKVLGLVNTMIVGFEEEWQVEDFAARVKKALEQRTKMT
ncbi:MAG: aldo/keto reductase [Candidatus Sumerlaeota bacterium]|nr:aldo/keto reductase [Candidatus Sumerlaeota bacterium]